MTFPMLGEQTHTLQTSSETIGSDGRPVRSYATAGSLRGSLQPANEHDLQRVREGVRSQVTDVLLSRSAVTLPDQTTATPGAPPRVVSADGVTYEVLDVAPYSRGPLTHWRVMLRRVPEHTSAGSP